MKHINCRGSDCPSRGRAFKASYCATGGSGFKDSHHPSGGRVFKASHCTSGGSVALVDSSNIVMRSFSRHQILRSTIVIKVEDGQEDNSIKEK